MTHNYNVKELLRLRDYEKIRYRAMDHPWINIYDAALGLGGEVDFVSQDLRVAGFTIPKDNLSEFTSLIDEDDSFTHEISEKHHWLLPENPALVIVRSKLLHSEERRQAKIEERKNRRRIRRRPPKPRF